VGAALVGKEELTVTGVDTVLKSNMVIVIITLEGQIELVEEEAVPLLGISSCFFSFSYHSVVHVSVSFQDWE
jgi:hypothetical protein